MQILWLSWRDIKNPQAGGAEKVAFEISRRFIKEGSKVTIFSSRFKNSKQSEKVKGVKIVRGGNRLTCRWYAFQHYLKNRHYGLIIDEINTIPFFSPLYAKDRSIALIHQLAREYWWYETTFPSNLIGFLAEPIYLKLYKNRPTIALGNSTTKDLKKLGFKYIKTYLPGVDKPLMPGSKKENLIIFIGRLTPAKNAQDAVLAFVKIHSQIPDSQLIIAGSGKPAYIAKVQSQVTSLNLEKAAQLVGFVPEKEKIRLLKRAKIILIPSIREGWSLVATEAQACGCVPIAYNVPGLRDSIKNHQTGILTPPNPDALAKNAIKVLANEPLRTQLSKNGHQSTKNMSWDNTYEDFKKALRYII